MELLSCALRDQRASFMDHLDLIFKWISLRLCEKENVKALGQVCHQDFFRSWPLAGRVSVDVCVSCGMILFRGFKTHASHFQSLNQLRATLLSYSVSAPNMLLVYSSKTHISVARVQYVEVKCSPY